MNTIFLLIWKYGDNSDTGVIKAFCDLPIAQEQLRLLNGFGDPSKVFSIIEVVLD